MSTTPLSSTLYNLVMFPYPSGATMHVGHASNYIPNDILVRKLKMQGKKIINPIGRDSFGLPTENFAIKQGKPASQVTEENIAVFKKQLEKIDMDYDIDYHKSRHEITDADHSREFATSDPSYYKWTQRIFVKLFEAGLVYRKEALVNRCPGCQTVIANDQVVDGCCERCESEIIQKKHPQRFIKITDYADRLLSDLDLVDRPEETKTTQRNRIGKSEGAEIIFKIGEALDITVFTTRPDTVYGVTAVMLAPEIADYDSLIPAEFKQSVLDYRALTAKKSAVERQQTEKDKSGVFSGLTATHPLTGQQVPIRFADYVLANYGTGAVMFVPAHDERDRDFYHKSMINSATSPQNSLHQDGGEKKTTGVSLLQDVIVPWIEEGDSQKTFHIAVFEITDTDTGEIYYIYDFLHKSLFYIDDSEDYIQALLAKSSLESRLTYTSSEYIGFFSNKLHAHKISFLSNSKNIEEIKNASHYYGLERSLSDVEKNIIATEKLGDIPIKGIGNLSSRVLGMIDKRFSIARGLPGVLINSEQFSDIESIHAKESITAHLESLGLGNKKTSYRLRDRSVSRQRYRGSPIPIYYDEEGIPHTIPESELPVVLPLDVANYKPAGKSPLEDHPTFKHYQKDGKSYLRECDTLDTFMCSSFYFLRFVDPHNPDQLASRELLDQVMPVDFYIGGKEHTVGHLLYSRFIHKFLYDQGIVGCTEPFQRLIHQGMVLGPDGRKMSKRRGNVITPDQIIDEYGSDTLRLYEMFMGPLEAEKRRDDNSLKGVYRFIERIKKLTDKIVKSDESIQYPATHVMIKGISEDIDQLKFNTAVSKMMIYINEISALKSINQSDFVAFLKIITPFATKVSQELWAQLGQSGLIKDQKWPDYDPSKIETQTVNLPIQINGKMRGSLDVAKGIQEDEVIELIKADEKLSKYIDGVTIKKIIYVQDKIMNVMV